MHDQQIETRPSRLARPIARMGRVPALIACALLGVWSPPSRAHDALAEYVWHRVALAADSRHINVVVTLTFFEDWSERERRRMDADGDGRIGRSEIERYTTELTRDVKPRITLAVGGQRVALTLLYAPEIALSGGASVARAHHQVTLHYFAALPASLAPGAEVVVEDRLWEEAPSFGEIDTRVAVEAAQFESSGTTERGSARMGSAAPLRFTARFMKSAGRGDPTR